MKNVELSEYDFNRLTDAHDKYYASLKKWSNLDKSQQELIEKVVRYEKALEMLTWNFGCTSPESMRMKDIAEKARYNK